MEINELPEHLKPEHLLEFKPYHFWTSPKQKSKITLSDNFTDEVMAAQNLHHEPEITHVLSLNEGKVMVVAKVTVWKNDFTANRVIAYASINEMPHKGGQSHYAQIAVTRALKIAVTRFLKISDHDVELIIDAYNIKKADVLRITEASGAVRESDTTDEPETTTEAPVEEINLDLGL